MKLRLTDGEKAGEVVEVEDSVGQAWLVSGKAESPDATTEAPVEEAAEEPDVAETPESPKRRSATKRKAEEPETR